MKKQNVHFGIRLVAYILDAAIIFPIMALIYRVLFLFSRTIFSYFFMQITAITIFTILYEVITTWKFGGTPGKLIMGCEVVHNKKRLTFLRSLGRSLGRYLSEVFFIGYFMIFWDKDYHALHDHIVKTDVIYTKDPWFKPQWRKWAYSALVILFALYILNICVDAYFSSYYNVRVEFRQIETLPEGLVFCGETAHTTLGLSYCMQAISTKNEAWHLKDRINTCDLIPDKEMRDICLTDISIDLGDPSLCDLMDTRRGSAYCLMEHNSFKMILDFLVSSTVLYYIE